MYKFLVFKLEPPLFTENYSVNYFFEHFDVPYSTYERIVS